MRTLIKALTTTALVAGSHGVLAVDANHGKSLLQNNCTSCHDDSIYTREERRVSSMDALRSQVQRCDTNLNLQWFPEDVDAVVEYLNTTYYQFK